jgi:hypothetical protein
MPEKNEEKPQVFNNAADELAALEVSIKQAQLADLKLQQRERELNMQDVRARIGDRETKLLQKTMDREAQGRTFAQQAATDKSRQDACTHKKGGVVSARNMQVLSTGGNSIQYAVLKHQMMNNDMWVRCLRCGKTWLPPVKENYYFSAKGKQVAPKDGTFNETKFNEALAEYRRAVNFETNNSSSGSVQCRFSKWDEGSEQWVDATVDYRLSVKDSNLR